MKKIGLLALIVPLVFITMGDFKVTKVEATEDESTSVYHMPLEDEEHEGTWLQWPHRYTYGQEYERNIQDIWVKMTKSLTKGKKEPYKKSNGIPKKISKDLGLERIDLNGVVLEGGAMELDGNGTFLATKSSIIKKNRNPNLSQAEIENYIKEYYEIKNFIWLDGVVGIDITDFHIDGFAKFYDKSTLITLNENDLMHWGVSRKDANKIIQDLYPNREVVGIDIRELYKDGGMIHCVTQQQPINYK
ncbi:MAG: agmatine deiminase family protein [Clostridium sp.]|uniref:agmatine deiminase family protein n=1 Tax=Clostridium sp. TaxID=1506 RepID=UPI00306A9D64